MKRVNILVSTLVLCSAMGLVGCGASNDAAAGTKIAPDAPIKAPVPVSANQPMYNGTYADSPIGASWISDCIKEDKTYVQTVLHFFKQGIVMESYSYDDSVCQKIQAFSAVVTNTSAVKTGPLQFHANISQAAMTDIVLMFGSDEQIKIMNSINFCKKSWAMGVPVSLAGTECMNMFPAFTMDIKLDVASRSLNVSGCSTSPDTGENKCELIALHKK